MIISLSGAAGSGKTTVALVVAKKLKLKSYYMGEIRRNYAKEKGITIEELNKQAEKDPTSDYLVDEYLKKLGQKEDNFIIQSRTAFHFLPKSIKIFLDVDIDEAAKRIFKDMKDKKASEKRNEKIPKDIKEMKKNIIEREKSDRKRYIKYYSIDTKDLNNYDLVIDTTKKTPSEVVDEIVSFAKNK